MVTAKSMIPNLVELTIEIEGGVVAGWEQIPKNKVTGPTIIALHGWLDNANSFVPMIKHLPDLHIISIDMPGHGLSDHRPPHSHYHMWDGVEALHRVIDELKKLGKLNSDLPPFLLGHSMGGAIASMFAGTFPDDLSGLFLIEAIGPLSTQPKDSPAQLADSILNRDKFRGKKPPVYSDYQKAVNARLNAMFEVPDVAAQLFAERGVASVEGGFKWRSDPRLRLPSAMRLTEEQVEAFLSGIKVPVDLVVGDKGLFKANQVLKRTSSVKDIKIHNLQGGHHLHMEEVCSEISKLLKTVFAKVVLENL